MRNVLDKRDENVCVEKFLHQKYEMDFYTAEW